MARKELAGRQPNRKGIVVKRQKRNRILFHGIARIVAYSHSVQLALDIPPNEFHSNCEHNLRTEHIDNNGLAI